MWVPRREAMQSTRHIYAYAAPFAVAKYIALFGGIFDIREELIYAHIMYVWAGARPGIPLSSPRAPSARTAGSSEKRCFSSRLSAVSVPFLDPKW